MKRTYRSKFGLEWITSELAISLLVPPFYTIIRHLVGVY